jgi:hypothetical protein
MDYAALCDELDRGLADAIEAHARWLSEPAALLEHRPAPAAWTAREVVEHVALANRYLAILAEKIAAKSAQRAARGEPYPRHAPDLERLRALSALPAHWAHPAHMTPGGTRALAEIAAELAAQRAQLARLTAGARGGEGTLHAIRISVVPGDARLDLYALLEFVRLHMARHLRQLDANRRAHAAAARATGP